MIHHSQTGFIKDRYIGETVRSISVDIMELTVEENIPGLMIFYRLSKGDSLEWKCLLKCLQYFNFGPDFIRWVSTFYKNIQSCVMNNGITSD